MSDSTLLSNMELYDGVNTGESFIDDGNLICESKPRVIVRRIMCRYGRGCTHMCDAIHRERFWHPPVPKLTEEQLRTHYICNECAYATPSLLELQLHLQRKTAWSNEGLIGSRISCLVENKEWHEGYITQFHQSGKHFVEFRQIGEKRWVNMKKVAFYIVERPVLPPNMTGEYKEEELLECCAGLAPIDNKWVFMDEITLDYAFAQSVLFKIFGGSVQETGHKTKGHVCLTDTDKDLAKSNKGSLLYGELLPRGANKAFGSRHLNVQTAATLFDMGMGTGKIPIQAFMQFRNLKYVYGVELSQGRYNLAEDAVMKMIHLLGPELFDVQMVPGEYMIVTERSSKTNITRRGIGRGRGQTQRQRHAQRNNGNNHDLNLWSNNENENDDEKLTLPQDDAEEFKDVEDNFQPPQDKSQGGRGDSRGSTNGSTLLRNRVLHIECGNMFNVRHINTADIVMMETDIPSDLHKDLCKMLASMKDNSRILSYLDLRKMWVGTDTFYFRQMENNRAVSDRFPTSWSVQRGHHFFLWAKFSTPYPGPGNSSSGSPYNISINSSPSKTFLASSKQSPTGAAASSEFQTNDNNNNNSNESNVPADCFVADGEEEEPGNRCLPLSFNLIYMTSIFYRRRGAPRTPGGRKQQGRKDQQRDSEYEAASSYSSPSSSGAGAAAGEAVMSGATYGTPMSSMRKQQISSKRRTSSDQQEPNERVVIPVNGDGTRATTASTGGGGATTAALSASSASLRITEKPSSSGAVGAVIMTGGGGGIGDDDVATSTSFTDSSKDKAAVAGKDLQHRDRQQQVAAVPLLPELSRNLPSSPSSSSSSHTSSSSSTPQVGQLAAGSTALYVTIPALRGGANAGNMVMMLSSSGSSGGSGSGTETDVTAGTSAVAGARRSSTMTPRRVEAALCVTASSATATAATAVSTAGSRDRGDRSMIYRESSSTSSGNGSEAGTVGAAVVALNQDYPPSPTSSFRDNSDRAHGASEAAAEVAVATEQPSSSIAAQLSSLIIPYPFPSIAATFRPSSASASASAAATGTGTATTATIAGGGTREQQATSRRDDAFTTSPSSAGTVTNGAAAAMVATHDTINSSSKRSQSGRHSNRNGNQNHRKDDEDDISDGDGDGDDPDGTMDNDRNCHHMYYYSALTTGGGNSTSGVSHGAVALGGVPSSGDTDTTTTAAVAVGGLTVSTGSSTGTSNGTGNVSSNLYEAEKVLLQVISSGSAMVKQKENHLQNQKQQQNKRQRKQSSSMAIPSSFGGFPPAAAAPILAEGEDEDEQDPHSNGSSRSGSSCVIS